MAQCRSRERTNERSDEMPISPDTYQRENWILEHGSRRDADIAGSYLSIHGLTDLMNDVSMTSPNYSPNHDELRLFFPP